MILFLFFVSRLFREEVKFAKPKKKKPIKGPSNKKPKNKEKESIPVLYNLTNISVFSNDTPSGAAESILKPPTATAILPKPKPGDKTFVDVINTVPVVFEVQENSVNLMSVSQEGDKNAPLPPAPDDASAKGDYKAPLPEKTTFFLLHLSLFRDYLDEEFKELRLNLEGHAHIK